MTPEYKERDFEGHIEQNLLISDYSKRESKDYDKKLCLMSEEVIKFISSSQPDEYHKLKRQYGKKRDKKICQRLAKEIRRKGALKVLRTGIKDRGAKFGLAYFKPSSGMNPKHRRLYGKNSFSIVRQLHYSKRDTKNSIDMVIFLNGIPIVTMELKNNLTGQYVEDAKFQYKEDRNPRNEPLLKYKRCLVHFAVDNEEIYMTTKLNGKKTRFLPFNKGLVNPSNPRGHKTAYLWEDILQPDTLLDLIDNYLHIEKDKARYYDEDRGKIIDEETEKFIFPRFHQFDCVRKIIRGVREEGEGHNYLVQHSAGSGKSNSIAWLSHKLSNFYQKETDKERLFDSIVVVTNRRVLDRQLRDTIKQFEQRRGVVKPIKKSSQELKEALEKGRTIIVTTLQKFPFISEEMSKLRGNKFAVIIDEAHSGHSGEMSKHLKKTLSVNVEKEDGEEEENEEEFDIEEKIHEEIRVRGIQPHISYFAFTATPKNKTLELFGRENEEEKFEAYHYYSMRQAIREGFILDVLENYTTYQRYFKLKKRIEEEEEYEKDKAKSLLTSYVDDSTFTIRTKADIMLDHFLEKTRHAIEGKGRAMVVTQSRKRAVKYFLAFKKLMRERDLPFKPLVSFSGSLTHPATGERCNERTLNDITSRMGIRDAFKLPEYRILVVAYKFQVGFDEPLLHTMYVDKKLGGVNAVQCLSRLNRKIKGKEGTFVLDFVNKVENIKQAFQPYYEATYLEEETDPNKLYDIKYELKKYEIFDDENIEDFAKIFFNPNEEMEKLQPILDSVVHIWRNKKEKKREAFRSLLQKFIRTYGYVSQIITFKDIVDLEKLYVFSRFLNKKLPKRERELPTEVIDAVDLESFRIQETYKGQIRLDEEEGVVKPPTNGTPGYKGEEEKDLLSNIIHTLNETYGADLTDEDRVDLQRIKKKIQENDDLTAVMRGDNTRDNKKWKFDQVLDDELMGFVNGRLNLYKKLKEDSLNKHLKDVWFERYLEELERAEKMLSEELKLKIELVPSTSWYNNLRKEVSREDWDKIRKNAYANANYRCEICGEKKQLHCHEKWNYNDDELLQKLEGFEAICVNCHMIKHTGFSMHTEKGKQQFDRDELINHFCKVNNCDRNDFLRHEEEAFETWVARSQKQWKVDLGEYKETVESDSKDGS